MTPEQRQWLLDWPVPSSEPQAFTEWLEACPSDGRVNGPRGEQARRIDSMWVITQPVPLIKRFTSANIYTRWAGGEASIQPHLTVEDLRGLISSSTQPNQAKQDPVPTLDHDLNLTVGYNVSLGIISIDLARSLSWIGLHPSTAESLAGSLIECAALVRQGAH